MRLHDKGVNCSSACALGNSHDEYNLDLFFSIAQEAVTY